MRSYKSGAHQLLPCPATQNKNCSACGVIFHVCVRPVMVEGHMTFAALKGQIDQNGLQDVSCY